MKADSCALLACRAAGPSADRAITGTSAYFTKTRSKSPNMALSDLPEPMMRFTSATALSISPRASSTVSAKTGSGIPKAAEAASAIEVNPRRVSRDELVSFRIGILEIGIGVFKSALRIARSPAQGKAAVLQIQKARLRVAVRAFV